MPTIVYVVGPTNAGKTHLMNAVHECPDMGTIEVGRMMRAKYPPEHFKGQNNPAHTAVEAWQMYLDGVAAQQDKAAIWCDGQPRDQKQMEAVLEEKNPRIFVHLWAPVAIREARARARDEHDPAKLALSLTRLNGDTPSSYDIITQLTLRDELVVNVRTDVPSYKPTNLIIAVRALLA